MYGLAVYMQHIIIIISFLKIGKIWILLYGHYVSQNFLGDIIFAFAVCLSVSQPVHPQPACLAFTGQTAGLISLQNFGWVQCLCENINKTIILVSKNMLLYVLFWMCVTIMYNNLHMQSLLKVNGLSLKWMFMEHIFSLSV